jgi:hypothetical protein
MDKQQFVSMVGPISLLSNAMHPPVDVGPLLHGHPILSQCASCWLLLWCPNLGTSAFTLGGHLFLSMVCPTWPLPIAMLSFVAVNPLLHGPLFACCVGCQHDGACCGVHSLLPQHSPWMGTCFSPWLVPPHHCQVPCTHLLLGINSCMAKCMPTRLAVSILLVARVLHFCYLNIHHGQPHHSPWTSNCLSPWLAPSLYCQMPCTLLWMWSTLAWPPHPLTVCLLLVAVVVSQPWYLNTHHGGAHVSPHGLSYLATANCLALLCGCESTPTWPPACLLCWLTV